LDTYDAIYRKAGPKKYGIEVTEAIPVCAAVAAARILILYCYWRPLEVAAFFQYAELSFAVITPTTRSQKILVTPQKNEKKEGIFF
jgi:hypothetical protein